MRAYLSLFISLLIHLVLIFTIFFYTKNNPIIKFDKTSINLNNVVEVEAIGLPNILKKDIKTFKDLKSIKETPKDKMVLNTNKNDSILKLKAISKLKDRINKESYLDKIKKIKSTKTFFKENKIINNILSSDNNISSKENEYFSKLKSIVHNNWELPSWSNIGEEEILIRCTIDLNGKINDIKIIKSSKNDIIDNLAFNAVKKASPFPSPPKSLIEILNEGIIFSFP